jgi:23S rRNA (pseudouridine1915-N3)-methyltransferase
MLTISIHTMGKDCKESWLNEALEIYLRRLKQHIQIQFHFHKSEKQLIDHCSAASKVLALDPCGKELDSFAFSSHLYKALEQGGSRLAFVIGGAEGLPQAIRQQYPLISLSKMTFTHQMTRLILVEQIFRAWSLREGHPYHKQ